MTDHQSSFSTKWAELSLGLFRIVTALLFLQHAFQKLFAFPSAYTYGSTAPLTFMWFAGMIELIGGTLVLLGFFTRVSAFILSGQMAIAYFMAHAPRGFFPIENGGELAIMFCFGFLMLAAAGPGALSVDGMRRKRVGSERPA
jgi:putative oxidoreductase